jgi:hypothetical protein
MKHQRHFDANDVSLKQSEQIRTLIADLDRLVRILDSDIANEEERAGMADRSEATYPMLARTLTTRRNNLRGTVAALEQRLGSQVAA